MSSGSSSFYVTPGQYRYLRACMVCSIVQPQQVGAPSFFLPALENETNLEQQKFIKEGCPNCEDAIHLRNNSEKVEDCTSPVFEGLVALWQPKQSWVSRWQRVDGFVRGMYAIKVCGNVCFLKAPPPKKRSVFSFFLKILTTDVLIPFKVTRGDHYRIGGCERLLPASGWV